MTSWVRVVRHDDGVVEVVLDRPEALNAVSTAFAREISATMADVGGDRTVRAVVLSSAVEQAFCVGADLKERLAFSDDDLRAQRPVTRAAYRAVLDLPMPAVAAVHGFALGGGFELALGCDLIVADETTILGLPEVSVGLVPGGGGTQLLTRRVGWSRAADVIFTARRLDGPAALALGCVDRLVPAGSARTEALALAAGIAANSPVGVRAAKRAMGQGLDTDLASGLDREDEAWIDAAFSPDRVEGVRAFAERRRPRWPSAEP